MHANASIDDMVAWLDAHLDAAKYRESEPDANGLLFRAGPAASKFCVAVSTSMATILAAAKSGAHLLVVHHPPWAEIDLALRDEKMQMLETAGISLYAAHASLDCAPNVGNAWVLASMLGVEVDATFDEYHGGHAGVIGRCEGDYASLIQRASQALRVEVEAHQHSREFGRVAIVTGAGGMTTAMQEAKAMGADTFFTGEGSLFTRMYAKDARMNLIFGTHQATEAPGIRSLGERLALESQIEWLFIDEASGVF